MIGPLAAIITAIAMVASQCGPCTCDKTPNYCAVIFGWPEAPVPGNLLLRQGPFDIVETTGFTNETWKMTCKGRIIAQKIDGSPNIVTGGVVNIYLKWPPDRSPWAGHYTWDGTGCWGTRPDIEQWGRCYLNPIVQG